MTAPPSWVGPDRRRHPWRRAWRAWFGDVRRLRVEAIDSRLDELEARGRAAAERLGVRFDTEIEVTRDAERRRS